MSYDKSHIYIIIILQFDEWIIYKKVNYLNYIYFNR